MNKKRLSKCKLNLFFLFVVRNWTIYCFCMTWGLKHTFLMCIVYRKIQDMRQLAYLQLK